MVHRHPRNSPLTTKKQLRARCRRVGGWVVGGVDWLVGWLVGRLVGEGGRERRGEGGEGEEVGVANGIISKFDVVNPMILCEFDEIAFCFATGVSGGGHWCIFFLVIVGSPGLWGGGFFWGGWRWEFGRFGMFWGFGEFYGFGAWRLGV